MFGSIGPLVISGFLLNAALDNEKVVERRVAAEDKGCISRLQSLGEVKTDKNDTATLTIKSIKDPRKAMDDATAAVFLCPQRTLTSFCLGDKCLPGDAVDMTLKMRRNR
jgi:hypothetical protein